MSGTIGLGEAIRALRAELAQTRQDGEGLSAPRKVKEYHVMVYVGRIPARLAATHGIPLEVGVDPLYGHIEVELWVCGDYVLRAIRSPYPADKRPYYLSGFQRRPGQMRSGGFWVTGAVHVASALVAGLEPDESYLRSVGMLDKLPQWRELVEPSTLDEEVA